MMRIAEVCPLFAGGDRMAEKQLLIVMATGVGRLYREYLLRSMTSRFRLHLFAGADPGWARDYVTGWTSLHNLQETIDAEEMCEAARKLAAVEPVHGIFTWDEARVLQGAKVAAALGLPGGHPDAVMRCRDKHLTREALAAAGVPQPASALVGTAEQALEAARRIGYPVVVKPRAMAASLGVVRADTPAQLATRFEFARDTTLPGSWLYETAVLVEEYLPEPEVSVDSAVHAGEVLPMFVARKEIGYPPYFEELGHVVDAADPLLADRQVRRVVQDAHTALGFTDGMTHTELKLTRSGPKVIEVNARLGGDLIPYLGLRATGMDPGLAAAAVACGQPPELTSTRQRVAAVRFFYVEQDDTTIDKVDFDRAALPDSVDLAEPLVEPGAVVSPPPKGTLFGRIAVATAVADTAGACLAALDAAAAALTVRAAGQPGPAQARTTEVE
jgi:biotin carboxylase